jgi:hypothetical protein
VQLLSLVVQGVLNLFIHVLFNLNVVPLEFIKLTPYFVFLFI